MSDDQSDEAAEAEYWEAYLAGDYSKALSAASRGLIRRGLRMLKADGVVIDFKRPPKDAVEFFGSIGAVLADEIEKLGEDAPMKMVVVQRVASALSDLQAVLSGRVVDDLNDGDRMALALLHAFRLGANAERLGLTASGLFDEFTQLKISHLERREKQGEAARRTNELKAEQRSTAVEAARVICESNPTLSNEDLAVKVRERSKRSTTVRTMTDWMRQARKDGLLPARRHTNR